MTGVPSPDPVIIEQLIAALVPATDLPRPQPAPLPALPPPMKTVDSMGSVLLATCVTDRSGRVGAAPLLSALGWKPGDLVEVDAVHGAAAIRWHRTGRHRIGSRGDISIPIAVRTMSGIHIGQPVLLAALPGHHILAVHPAASITRLLARVHRRIVGDTP